MEIPQKTIIETKVNQLTKPEYQRQIDAIRLIPQALRAALSLGVDKDAAIQGANRAVAVITGVNVLELFSVEAPKIEKYYTLSALAKRLKISTNLLTHRLQELGFIDKDFGVTKSGKAFYVDYNGFTEKMVDMLQAGGAK